MNKYWREVLLSVFLVLAMSTPVYATSQQFRQLRLVYSEDCDCYRWKEFIVIVLPFASTGEEGEQNPENLRHPDLSGDSRTLGTCDAGVCVINVLFEDFPMNRCISVTWAKLIRVDTAENGYVVTDLEQNFTLQRREDGFVATFVASSSNDNLNASKYALTLDCSKFEPVPFN